MTRIKVHVNWSDPAVGNTWREMSDAAKDAPHPAEAMGYLIEKNDQYIVIAPHVSGTQCNGDITIPRALILSMNELIIKPEMFLPEAAPSDE
jgi:hypothetical protein